MKTQLNRFLRWSQKYTKTDMVYVANGAFWLTLARGGAMTITLIVLVAFANVLPKETVGAYQYILSVATIAGLFTLTGMNEALIRAVARGAEGALGQMTSMRLRWGVLGSLALFAGAAWYWNNSNLELAWAFFFFGLLLPFFFTFNGFIYVFWIGREDFRQSAVLRLGQQLLSAAAVISMLFLTSNVAFIIAVYIGSQTLFATIGHFWTQLQVRNDRRDEKSVSLGIHLTLMNIVASVSNYLDSIILWHFLGPVALATYTFARQPSSKLMQIIPISMLALPKLSKKHLDQKMKKGVLAKFFRLFLLSLPITFLLIILAPTFFGLLFPTYPESVPYFQALSLTVAFLPFTLLHTSLTAAVKTRALYLIQFAVPGMKIILFTTLIPLFGIWGAISAVLAGKAMESFLTTVLFIKAS